jgi:phosphate transport system substrate-binding protein
LVAPYEYAALDYVSGSDVAAAYVGGNPGAITAVESPYAPIDRLPCASIENASGAWVQPNNLGDGQALSRAKFKSDGRADLRPVFTAPEATAYPLSFLTYFVTAKATVAPDVGQALGRFIKYAACPGQTIAPLFADAVLTPNLVNEDFVAIRHINGATYPGPLTGANCANPYLDGALPPPS